MCCFICRIAFAAWRQAAWKAREQRCFIHAKRAKHRIQPAGWAFFQHRILHGDGGETQRRSFARCGFFHQHQAGAGDHQVKKGLMHFKCEIGTIEMGLQHLGRFFQNGGGLLFIGVLRRAAGRQAEPARPGRRQFRKQ